MSAVSEKTSQFSFAHINQNGANEIYYPESDGKPMGETDYHITLITDLLQWLRTFFIERNDVYVAGDLMFYYKENDVKKVVAPDVMVCFNTHKNARRIYKLWEEVRPVVMIEISSTSTWKRDLKFKKELYQEIGVKEYFVLDPMPKNRQELPMTIIAFHLVNGEYEPQDVVNKRVMSQVLGLEFVSTENGIRLSNPQTGKFLSTLAEAEAEARNAEAEARNAEAQARQKELENQQLRAEIERLKNLR